MSMKTTLLITCSILLMGCSSQWHLRKAIKKDPSILQTDTMMVTVIDTFITAPIHIDTSFLLSNDTVTIIRDNVTVKHYYNRQTDSVWILVEKPTDTLIQEKIIEVPVDRWITPKVRWWEWLPPIWVWLLGIGFLVYRKWFRTSSTS